MAEGPPPPFSATGRWRPRQGRRLRRADCREARRQPADGQRTTEGAEPGWPAPLQADQAVDVLQARRTVDSWCQKRDSSEAISPWDRALRQRNPVHRPRPDRGIRRKRLIEDTMRSMTVKE